MPLAANPLGLRLQFTLYGLRFTAYGSRFTVDPSRIPRRLPPQLLGPPQKPSHPRSLRPEQSKKAPCVQVRCHGAEESLHAPADIGASPGAETVAFRRYPVEANRAQHFVIRVRRGSIEEETIQSVERDRQRFRRKPSLRLIPASAFAETRNVRNVMRPMPGVQGQKMIQRHQAVLRVIELPRELFTRHRFQHLDPPPMQRLQQR